MKPVIITGETLTLQEFVDVARHGREVVLADEAKEKVLASRKVVDDLVEEHRVVYGITTGFGKFSSVTIGQDDCKLLQRNLIITHSVGNGDPFSKEEARGIMLLRVNNLAKGFSGARLETVQTLIDMLNKGVTPQIPQKGSLGASGDLAPLAHMVLPMIGLGEAEYEGKVLPGAEAMEKAGIPVIELVAKEGLALINGTQAMTSCGSLALYDALQLMKVLDIAVALNFEAHRGVIDAMDDRLNAVRPHQGQKDTSRIVRQLLEGSKNVTRQGELRVQDAYVLRCCPQIHGASKDALNYVKGRVEIELNAVTDNPIIFKETMEGISGGNFHGQPMALPFDFLGIAAAEMGNVSERRVERAINSDLSGLPAFLATNGGVDSGFMIVQYSAAAHVSENKVLAHPASVDSIPSSMNQEDHVSMGTIAARKARDIVANSRRVITSELMCICQAIDMAGNKDKMGKGTAAAYNRIREEVATLNGDRPLYGDLNAIEAMIKDGSLVERVETAVGAIEF
ncbi:MAG: histidine ammonia-lyase [Lachnospiraceae bacterium]|jgi:histidine ammonia-lyase